MSDLPSNVIQFPRRYRHPPRRPFQRTTRPPPGSRLTPAQFEYVQNLLEYWAAHDELQDGTPQ